MSNILGWFYKFDSVRALKNLVRPFKHLLFGKSGVYKVIDDVARLEGGAGRVSVVFDVGASVGEYALQFLRDFPSATVYCFEPVPESFDKLKERMRSYESRVRLFNVALSDRNGISELYVSPHRDGSSLVLKDFPGLKPMNVPVMRLDDFAAEHGIGKIDFIKIDVEGFEKEVIDGGQRVFRDAISNAFIEIQPEFKGYYSVDHVKVFELLHDYGFGFAGVFGDYFFSKLLPHKKL